MNGRATRSAACQGRKKSSCHQVHAMKMLMYGTEKSN